jgi:hypothetical protein
MHDFPFFLALFSGKNPYAVIISLLFTFLLAMGESTVFIVLF